MTIEALRGFFRVPYLVDGNNLIGSSNLRLRDPSSRQELVRRLSAFARQRRASVVLIFDGAGDAAREVLSLGTLKVTCSGAREADTVIREQIERAGNPRDWILVTSDRALRSFAQSRGVRVMDSRQFWQAKMDKQSGGTEKPERVDVDDWLRYFHQGESKDKKR